MITQMNVCRHIFKHRAYGKEPFSKAAVTGSICVNMKILETWKTYSRGRNLENRTPFQFENFKYFAGAKQFDEIMTLFNFGYDTMICQVDHDEFISKL